LHTTSTIPGPFIDGRRGVVIDRRKCQFIEPGGDVAFGSDVPGGLARSEGDSQNPIFFEGHRARQGCYFPVVHDLERDVFPGAFEFEKKIFDSLVE